MNGAECIRLFCFPYAGGGTAPFFEWTKHISPNIELLRVQLPGREIRLREASFVDISSLVDTLSTELMPWLRRPFAFFGHSMGALIAYETARKLSEMGNQMPTHLFVSSFRAPHLPDPDLVSPDLPDKQFLNYLLQYEGIPDAVMKNKELMDIFLPILRADFQVIASYRVRNEWRPIECPITLFGGISDPKTSKEEMDEWRLHTTAKFQSHYFEGGHFYIHEAYPEVIEYINQCLRPLSSNLFSGQ